MIFQPIIWWWLLLILFLPILTFCGWVLIKNWRDRKGRLPWIRRTGAILILLVACLRPAIPGGISPSGVSSVDVIFVIDTTISMSAEDYDGTKERLEGVRSDIKDIAKELAGARFSVISFANISQTAIPLTTDTSAIGAAVDTLLIGEASYGRGSSISQPLDILRSTLEKNAKRWPERAQVVFYVGDGEHNTDEKIESFDSVKRWVSGGAVLGYGTESGGKMTQSYYKEFGGSEDMRYIKDFTTKEYPIPIALSKINHENLRKIAEEMKVKYYHRTSPGGVSEVVAGIDIGKITNDNRKFENYQDIYWLFAPVFSMLAVIDLTIIWREIRAVRAQRRLYAEQ